MATKEVLKKIDILAEQFYFNKSKKYFDAFIVHAAPIIWATARRACRTSSWDVDELYSILLVDMWRLFNRWQPQKDKKFHWLMLRQLQNKTINYVNKQIGPIHKICPICGKRQTTSTRTRCSNCKESLRSNPIIHTEIFDCDHSYSPDYLTATANRELVQKLFDQIKNDPKTCAIMRMLLAGETKSNISNEIKIAQNALNNRIKKCKKILESIIKE